MGNEILSRRAGLRLKTSWVLPSHADKRRLPHRPGSRIRPGSGLLSKLRKLRSARRASPIKRGCQVKKHFSLPERQNYFLASSPPPWGRRFLLHSTGMLLHGSYQSNWTYIAAGSEHFGVFIASSLHGETAGRMCDGLKDAGRDDGGKHRCQ
jgi:hypothetical protein